MAAEGGNNKPISEIFLALFVMTLILILRFMRKLKGIIINGEYLGNKVAYNGLFRTICNISPIIILEFIKLASQYGTLYSPIEIKGFDLPEAYRIIIKFENKKYRGYADLSFVIQNGKLILSESDVCVESIMPTRKNIEPEPVQEIVLEEIKEENYNTRANQLILKVLKPLEIETLDKISTAIVAATTNSGVEEYETSRNPKHFEIGNPAEFVHKYFGFTNFYTSVSTACSSGIKAFSIARELLENGIAETVLVIGVDSIAKLPVYGFDSLEILSGEPANPFSKNRCGINIGEGAAAFIVSKEGEGIEIAGIGETTDYYHSTTPDPEGIEGEKAIRLALGEMKPEDTDYINLHGTGTQANDLMEARAVYNIFGAKVPASSTKPLTGHGYILKEFPVRMKIGENLIFFLMV